MIRTKALTCLLEYMLAMWAEMACMVDGLRAVDYARSGHGIGYANYLRHVCSDPRSMYQLRVA